MKYVTVVSMNPNHTGVVEWTETVSGPTWSVAMKRAWAIVDDTGVRREDCRVLHDSEMHTRIVLS